MMISGKMYLAADQLELGLCKELLEQVGSKFRGIKIHDLYDRHGPGVVEELLKAGAREVWVDAKLKDIPETVLGRAKAYKDAGAATISVHAEGEVDMMMAALQSGMNVYAITVLTSISKEQVGEPVEAKVLYLARLAKLAGVHGVVCSAQEVKMLSKRPELARLELIVPGTRSPGKEVDDQKRTGTPSPCSDLSSTWGSRRGRKKTALCANRVFRSTRRSARERISWRANAARSRKGKECRRGRYCISSHSRGLFLFVCPRQELNLHPSLRTGVFYPLNYKDLNQPSY